MAPGSAKRSPPSSKGQAGQASLLSFFKKREPGSSPITPKPKVRAARESSGSLPSPSLLQPDLSSDGPTSENIPSAQPSLSTPLNSSQDVPTSSPTRSATNRSAGGRIRKRAQIIDSDSEPEIDEDSSDEWAPGAAGDPQVSDGDGDEKMDDLVDDDFDETALSSPPPPLKRPSAPRPTKPSHSPASNSPEPRSSPAPAAALSVSRDLNKFTKDSSYTAEAAYSGTHTAPPPKKVRVSEDPERYKWLLHIKDADGHSEDHPDYDPRTLYVPSSAWAKFTPFEKQYWEVKQNLWNTVVFFKKGKFYELYENDAAIAHQLFDLKLAGGGRANMSLCGVPESTFDYWAGAFIAKGYKVARVDQAETALGKEMRDIAAKKKEEKIIKRELSCVLTAGTLTDGPMLVSDLSQYCMAIRQDGLDFAACFVDTATSQFSITRFTDKSGDYPLLETLVAQTRPKELVLPRGNLDKFATKIIKNNTSVDTLWEIVKPDSEFWDGERTRRELEIQDYFGSLEAPKDLTAALDDDLSASAIGGLIWYLRQLKLDQQLLGLGQFYNYDATATSQGTTMVLDGQTLQNLEVFANSWDGGAEGTLFKLVNKCITPFGKRRLRSWIAHPLQRPEDIGARADAVDMLMAQDEVISMLADKLVGLPDAERMLSRVHAGSLKPRDFVRLVGGLESMARLLAWLESLRSQLPQIAPFISTADTAIESTIEPWLTAFDHVQAKTQDLLIPEPGVDLEFDETKAAVTQCESLLYDIMKQYRKQFSSTQLEYRDSGKEIFLIEVPSKLTSKVPRDWQQMGSTAKFKRYWSPEVRKLVRQLQEAQELHKIAALSAQQKLYSRFCENYEAFMGVTRTISVIDCLVSLARTSQNMAVHCRPEILPISAAPIMEFVELRHPMARTLDFIPNDVHLGGSGARMSLLTGANAAGKSTVLRMTGCAALLAQLGCHVPAAEARLTPVDRIMTRLGASDNIFAGKSTFHMELAETERILSEASPRSLVVLDELGRGGSSSDGFAIAEAVLHHLATHVQCLGFFATHYASLYDSFATHPAVKPERMAIEVNSESREVTFMYKLEAGRSEGSFGMNVAAMCGVSESIVSEAERAARDYEHTSKLRRWGHSQDVPLGLQSDVVWSLSHMPSESVLKIMLSMAE